MLQGKSEIRLVLAGLACVVCMLGLCGCAGGTDTGGGDVARARLSSVEDRPAGAASAGLRGESGARPVALLGDRAVTLDELAARLLELGGGAALEELALDDSLEREVARAGLRITSAEVSLERERLLGSIAEESQVSAEQAERLLDQLRRGRGLGPTRFDGLLLRNARLRALVGPDVTITPEAMARETDLLTTPRKRIRLLTTSDRRIASDARQRLGSINVAQRSSAFAAAALAQSTDASSDRGGLMPSVHPLDPALPATIRAALGTLAIGDLSDVLAMDDGFALVLVEGDASSLLNPSDPRTPGLVERRLRVRLERLAMDALAQRLVRESGMRVLDPSLSWSWDSVPRP